MSIASLVRTTLCALTLIALSGCGKNTSVIERSAGERPAACLKYKPITFSSKDTPETKRQIMTHNSRWECDCNKKCG